ncbi:MAG: hypothetical protein AABZ30_08645, partial [Myxococcota bacterium]
DELRSTQYAADVLAGDEEAPRPRASVLVLARPGPPPLADDDVRRLVAGAVPGLDAADVAVVFATRPAPPRAVPPPSRPRPALHVGVLAATALLGAALAFAALRNAGLRRRLGTADRKATP